MATRSNQGQQRELSVNVKRAEPTKRPYSYVAWGCSLFVVSVAFVIFMEYSLWKGVGFLIGLFTVTTLLTGGAALISRLIAERLTRTGWWGVFTIILAVLLIGNWFRS